MALGFKTVCNVIKNELHRMLNICICEIKDCNYFDTYKVYYCYSMNVILYAL